MKAYRNEFPIGKMAKTLGVSRSGYYKYINRSESKRFLVNRTLLDAIMKVYKQNKGVYGSPRIHRALKKDGYSASRKRIARLMRENCLQSKIRKKWKPATPKTTNKENSVVAPNLLQQNFETTAENLVWVSDITYIHTNESWLYVAAILDLYSRKIVGLAMSNKPDTELTLQALRQAICHRQPKPGLVVHSDRGCQYTSFQYREFVKKCGIVQSMSAKGNCYDNAPMESFFHTLKTEHVFFCNYLTREQAKEAFLNTLKYFIIVKGCIQRLIIFLLWSLNCRNMPINQLNFKWRLFKIRV